MNKIPVGATIAHAYRFAFGKFPALLSIAWLPFAIMVGAGLLVVQQRTLLTAAMVGRNFSGIAPAFLVLGPFYIGIVLLLMMTVVGMTEQALGRRRGSSFFYFTIGRPLWLLTASVLLFVLLFVGIAIAAGLGAALITLLGSLLAGASQTVSMIVTLIGMLAVYLALIYVLVRFSFLMTPVVVAEDRIGLGRAWQLGKGNFWRMFAILLTILVPFFAIEIAFMLGFLFQGLPPTARPGASPAELQAAQAAAQAWSAAMTQRMTLYWYITYPFFVVFSLLFYGLLAGAQAFAYRALVPDHETAAEAFS
jgi:hypothetical protein